LFCGFSRKQVSSRGRKRKRETPFRNAPSAREKKDKQRYGSLKELYTLKPRKKRRKKERGEKEGNATHPRFDSTFDGKKRVSLRMP